MATETVVVGRSGPNQRRKGIGDVASLDELPRRFRSGMRILCRKTAAKRVFVRANEPAADAEKPRARREVRPTGYIPRC